MSAPLSAHYQNGDMSRTLAQLQEQVQLKDLVIAAQDQLVNRSHEARQELEARLANFESYWYTPALYRDDDQTMGFWKSNAAVGMKITGTVQHTSEGMDSIIQVEPSTNGDTHGEAATSSSQLQGETWQPLPAIPEVEEEHLEKDDEGLKDLIEDFAAQHITEIEEAESNIGRIKTKFETKIKDLVATYHTERLAHAAVVEKLKDENQQTNGVYFSEIQNMEKEHKAEMDRLVADHRVEYLAQVAENEELMNRQDAQVAENEELKSRRGARDVEINKVKEELATAKELIGHLMNFITLQYEGKMPLKGEKIVDL